MSALVSVASAAFFTRVLDAAAFGRASIALSVQAGLAGIGTAWLQQAILRYLPSAKDARLALKLKQTSIVAAVFAFVGILVTGLLAATLLRGSLGLQWRPLLLPAALATASTAFLGAILAILQALFLAREHAVARIVGALLRFSLGVALVLFFRMGEAALVWALAISNAAVLCWLWSIAGFSTAVSGTVKWADCFLHIKKFAAYGVPLAVWYVAAQLLYAADRYIIQFARGSAEVGLYTASYDLVAGSVQLLSGPLLLAVHPYLIRTLADISSEEIGARLSRVLRWASLFGALASGFVWIFGERVVRRIVGPDFGAGASIVPLVFLGVFIWNLGFYVHKPLELAERSGVLLALGLAAAVVNVALNIALVPSYGYRVAAVTTLVAYAVYLGLVLAYLHSRMMIRVEFGESIVTFCAIGVACFCVGRGMEALAGRAGEVLGLAAGAMSFGVVAWFGYQLARRWRRREVSRG